MYNQFLPHPQTVLLILVYPLSFLQVISNGLTNEKSLMAPINPINFIDHQVSVPSSLIWFLSNPIDGIERHGFVQLALVYYNHLKIPIPMQLKTKKKKKKKILNIKSRDFLLFITPKSPESSEWRLLMRD